MMNFPPVSGSLAVKDFLLRYPLEAFEFLVPDLWFARGRPDFVEIFDPPREMDWADKPESAQSIHVSMRFGFEFGPVVVLDIEASAFQFDPMRQARNFLELSRRYPDAGIYPVSLDFGDRRSGLTITLERGCGCDVIFAFRPRFVAISGLEFARYRDSRNPLALFFSPKMAGSFHRGEQVLRVAEFFQCREDLEGLRAFVAWAVDPGNPRQPDS